MNNIDCDSFGIASAGKTPLKEIKMGTSRRDFLKKGSLVALAAGVPISFAEQAMARTTTRVAPGLLLTKNVFAPLLETDFVVTSGGRKVSLRLMQVSDLPKPRSHHS